MILDYVYFYGFRGGKFSSFYLHQKQFSLCGGTGLNNFQ